MNDLAGDLLLLFTIAEQAVWQFHAFQNSTWSIFTISEQTNWRKCTG